MRRSLQDVRVKRGADAAPDHHLVVARLKLKLKQNWTGAIPHRNRYDIGRLKDAQKLEEYSVTVRNKYQLLQELMEDEETVDSTWKRVKESYNLTCKEVLGPKKHHHKGWISEETLSTIEETKEKKAAVNSSRTRAEKSNAQREYLNANNRAKKNIRAHNRKYIDG